MAGQRRGSRTHAGETSEYLSMGSAMADSVTNMSAFKSMLAYLVIGYWIVGQTRASDVGKPGSKTMPTQHNSGKCELVRGGGYAVVPSTV